jgi:5'-methylthioadenosine phosphorylase/purine-nucleoside phosphorylase
MPGPGKAITSDQYHSVMPIHLRAEPGDYAPAVLCPGDPNRARYIAETLFDPGAVEVNTERGLLGYTGTFGGHPLSVQATGMGSPSVGIVCEELIMLGARRLIRVGTCGGLGPRVAMGDVVVALSASADDDTALRYAAMAGYAPTATWALVRGAVDAAERAGLAVHVGPVVTSGLFYDPDTDAFARWRRLGHVGVEMEAAMLYTLAATHGIEALAVLVVSDTLTDDGATARISDHELRAGVDRVTRLAAQVAVGVATT